MAVDVLVETTIGRPREAVAAFAGDPSNAPRWYANIKTVEWQHRTPDLVGSKVTFTAHFLGKKLVYTYELVEVKPGECLVMRTAQGPFPMETTYTWRDLGDGKTHMTLRNRGEPRGFSRLVAPMMERAMRKATTKDLARLKSLLESPPAP